MQPRKHRIWQLAAAIALPLALSHCTADGKFNTEAAIGIGMGALQAGTLSEDQVKQAASLSAQEMDSKSTVASANSPYTQRLQRLTSGLASASGLNLNFKVYETRELNAFAMADGTVRVYSGLMDVMPDDQILAVIGHEIGHVKLKHSYKQLKETLLTDTAFKAVGSVGGNIGALTQGELGKLAESAINARFSQKDELEADAFSVRTLAKMGKNPIAMRNAILTLKQHVGDNSSFLSSHPSNDARIANIDEAIRKLGAAK
ncbi:Peptidase family M48 [gamma proteobacterium HdN1]|nr:Peptidase family M48 [gamma proteobacterium HdN1]